jgi:hypothetical protein
VEVSSVSDGRFLDALRETMEAAHMSRREDRAMLRSVVAALGFITILAVLIIVGVLTVNSLGAGLGGGAPDQIDAAKHAKKQSEDVQKKLEKDLKKGEDY